MSESDVKYQAYFTSGDKAYLWKEYKNPRLCLRYLRNKWSNPNFRTAGFDGKYRGFDGWYMVRHTGYFDDQGYRIKGVIIAQTRDCKPRRTIREVG